MKNQTKNLWTWRYEKTSKAMEENKLTVLIKRLLHNFL